MKQNQLKILIFILAVLLIAVSCALVWTVVRLNQLEEKGVSVVTDNKIDSQTPAYAAVSALGAGPSQASGLRLLGKTDEKITLTDVGKESATPFVVPGMLPGDSVTKEYKVSVNDDSAKTLTFSAAFTDNTVNPTDAQKNRDRSLMKLTVKANGSVIYSGDLDSVSDTDFALKGAKSVTYSITVSLDETAGNEYAKLSLGMVYSWKFGYEDTVMVTVTYSDGVGGTAFKNESYTVAKGSPMPQFQGLAYRVGYRFDGWSSSVSGTAETNVTITARWRKLISVIYTDGVAGEEIFKNQVYSVAMGGYTPSFSGTPKREGYEFIGWSPNVSRLANADVTYVAQWKILQYYTVIYTDGVADDVVFEDVVHQNLLADADTPAFGEDPVRPGYTFKGWNPTVADKVSGNVTYTAQWEMIPTYSVTYTDGILGVEVFADRTVTGLHFGDPTPVFTPDPSYAGFVFKGWNPTVSETVTGNVTYTAQWEAMPSFSVIYTDGVENEEVFPDRIFRDLYEGNATPAFPGTPTRTGYAFKGWNPTVAETVSGDVTYTAQWEMLPTYTVIYTDGAEGEEVFADQTYSSLLTGAQTPLFEGTPTRAGYTFKGWNPEVSATVSGNITYTAQWEPIPTYTVTYTDGAEGEEVFADRVFEGLLFGEATPLFEGAPVRDGYFFEGWNPAVSETVSASVTYVAQWREIIRENVEIDRDNPDITTSISIFSPNGGEEWTYQFVITVGDRGEKILFLEADSEDTDDLYRSLKVRVVCDETGLVLYDGPLSEFPDPLTKGLEGKKGEKIHLTVTFSLDEEYADRFADQTAEISLRWRLKEHCFLGFCPICFLTEWWFGRCIWPICLIIYFLILALIVFLIVHGAVRKNRIRERLEKEMETAEENEKKEDGHDAE